MSTTLEEQINQLKHTIAEMESQRDALGNETVEAALVPLHKKLAELESQGEPSVESPPEMPTRQRKLVTLLYMDVVGSTAMTQHLDPEDNLEIMEKALLSLIEPIKEHSGRITRYTGDGFKAVFGDPVAREDDPEQAIRAGLEILEVSKKVAQGIEKEWGIEDFQVRIGVDTGLAALGGQTEAEDTVKGRVVNMAKRIESAAPSGGLLISHNTYRHVRGVFNVEPQEPILAKGFPEPIPVYLVKEIKPRAFRVQTRGVEGVETQMVGRHDELRFLQDALMTVFEEGEGHVITVSGEAGVGKSRLLYEFQNWLDLLPSSQAVRFFQGRGRQEAQGSPYSLLRDVFAFRFQISDDDTGEEARRKIEAVFGEIFSADENGMMRAHILGQLLGFDFSASPHLKSVLNDAEQLRNRFVMYLIQYFQKLSQEIPVVIFLEDIHWGDDSSLDVVSRIGEFTPQHPVLIVCAARPVLFERRPYWGEGQPYHSCIELRPLSKRESRQLVAEILQLAVDIPSELRELIVRGAEGNPFYTEELIKMLIEDGVVIPEEENWQIDLTRLEEVDVPSTLAGVLQARLDSLPPLERAVLQQASVVGRLFWDRIVSYIQAEGGNGDDPQLIPLVLTSLRNRELVYRHEESAFVDSVEYLFKHDVLREVTYESVLKRLRKTYHGYVADWLIDNSGDRISEYSGLIAEHLLFAGRKVTACEYFTYAGDSALASFANHEAEGYFRKASKLSPNESFQADILTGLGEALYRRGETNEASEHLQQAILLYKGLGDNYHMGYIYSRLSYVYWHTESYLKAWELCQEGLALLEGASDNSGYARLLAEAGRTAYFIRAGDEAASLCQRSIEMAQRVGDKEIEAEASITLALQKKDIKEKISILEKVIVLAEAEKLMRTASRAHNNLAASIANNRINPEAAHYHNVRSVEIARQIGDMEGMLSALRNLYWSYIFDGELTTVEGIVNEILNGFPVPKSRSEKFHNENNFLLLQCKGEWNEALEKTREPIDGFREEGMYLPLAIRNDTLAELILDLNRFESFTDLSEAEAALEENININIYWMAMRARYLLAIIFARQKRFPAARDNIVQAEINLSGIENYAENEMRRLAEFELALAEERWGDAVIASESSLEIMRGDGARWQYARRLIDFADALISRNDPGDLERAHETYQQSLDMFTEMGAPGYIKVLEERLGDL